MRLCGLRFKAVCTAYSFQGIRIPTNVNLGLFFKRPAAVVALAPT